MRTIRYSQVLTGYRNSIYPPPLHPSVRDSHLKHLDHSGRRRRPQNPQLWIPGGFHQGNQAADIKPIICIHKYPHITLYSPMPEEDLWLNCTSGYRSLSSIFVNRCQRSTSLTLQSTAFSCPSLVEPPPIISAQISTIKLWFINKKIHAALLWASSLQPQHIPLFSRSCLVKNKYNCSLHARVKLRNNYPSQWVLLSPWMVECSGESY